MGVSFSVPLGGPLRYSKPIGGRSQGRGLIGSIFYPFWWLVVVMPLRLCVGLVAAMVGIVRLFRRPRGYTRL